MKHHLLPLLSCALLLAACTDLTGPDPDAPAFREAVPAAAPALVAGALDEPRDDVPFIRFDVPERDDNPVDFSASILDTAPFSVTVRLMARVEDGNLYYCRRRLQFGESEIIGTFNGRYKETLAELSRLADRIPVVGAASWVEYWLEDDARTVASPRIRLILPGARRP